MKPEEKIIHSIISSSIAAYWLREINHESIVRRQREQNLIKKTVETLLPYEQEMERIDKEVPEALEGCYDNYFNYIKQASKVPINLSEQAEIVLKAFLKDPRSLIGIAKKVLR